MVVRARWSFAPAETEPKAKIYALASGAGGLDDAALDRQITQVDATIDAVLADARARAQAVMAPILDVRNEA